MNLTSRGKTYLLIVLLSFLFSYSLITLNSFPYLGVAATLITFALFSYNYKLSKNSETKQYLFFTLLFSLAIAIRSEPFITFLNFAASLFSGCLMLSSANKKDLGILDYISSPIILVIKSLFIKNDYFWEQEEGKNNSQTYNPTNLIFGSVMSILVLTVVLPLLGSANPFFQKLVENIWHNLNLEQILNNIGYEILFTWSIRLVFFLGFLFMIPKIITLVNKSTNFALPFRINLDSLSLVIPKLVLVIVLMVFFVTQIQFYFADVDTLSNLGLTYSKHAREVFGQLSVVAGVVMLLLYNDRKDHLLNKVLNYTLGLQGIFLTLMAFKSDFEYINAWGLTYIRLYGLIVATWITGVFVLFFNYYLNLKNNNRFIKTSIIFSAIILIAVNILNFDYLIYHFKKATTGQGIDYTYLSELSPDSLSYKDQFLMLEKASKVNLLTQKDYHNEAPFVILFKIDRLQHKYAKFDLRTFNLFEYLQYLDIQSIKTEELRVIIAKIF